MADGSISIKIVGDSNDAQRAVDHLTKKYEKLEGQIKANRIAAKQGSAVQDLQKWATSVLTVGAAYSAISTALKSAVDYQKELIRLSDEAGRKQDARTRTFAANVGLNRQQSLQAEQMMNRVAVKTATDMPLVQEAASQLGGAGFNWKEAAGGAVEELLKGRAVTGGGDAGDLGRNVAMALNAKGLGMTSDNVRMLMSSVQGSRAAGNVESTTLQFLARQLSASKRPIQEDLALANLLQDVTTEEPAATAFGSFVRAGDAPKDKVKKVMKKHGLLTADGHFLGQGKSFAEQLDIVGTVADKLPESEKGEFFKGMYGAGQDATTLRAAVQNRHKFKAKLDAAYDVKGYQRVLDGYFGGLEFAAKAGEIEQEQWNAEQVTPGTTLAQQRDLLRKKSGMSPFRSMLMEKAGGITRAMGMGADIGERGARAFSDPLTLGLLSNPGSAAYGGGRMVDDLTNDDPAAAAAAKTVNARLADALEENNKLTKENNALLKPNAVKRPIAVNANEP